MGHRAARVLLGDQALADQNGVRTGSGVREQVTRTAHAGLGDLDDTVRDPPGYPAVRAMLVRLEKKGYIRHQEDGVRYHGRDVAIWRARRRGVPIVLGTATPSLETLENAAQGRYAKHLLPQRPGGSQAPRMALVWCHTARCNPAC